MSSVIEIDKDSLEGAQGQESMLDRRNLDSECMVARVDWYVRSDGRGADDDEDEFNIRIHRTRK